MIRFDNVSKQYPDGTKAVHTLNVEIQDGEFFVMIGPSGCGKTTTLKMINRLIDMSDGAIVINGKNINDYNIYELRWEIGYVLQQIALFPHMTIEENIAIVPELMNWNKKKIGERVTELLEMVGLDPKTYRHRKPVELSGGEQQRIGVARALAVDPKIILMDEPFSALDPISREKLQDELLDLQKRIKKTIVFVTHDMKEALKLGDRVCVMRGGEIIQVGTPTEILSRPSDDFVSEFIGSHTSNVYGSIDLGGIVKALPDGAPKPAYSVLPTASLKEVLDALVTDERIAVEQDGALIGVVDRQAVIQQLAGRMQEEGQSHE